MNKCSTGFSLIEVLVSLLLLSLILLGVDAMEMMALQENRHAYFFSVADTQLNSMIKQLRTVENDADITTIIKQWNQQNQSVLPQGKGDVIGSFPHYIVTISWKEKGEIQCLTQGVSV